MTILVVVVGQPSIAWKLLLFGLLWSIKCHRNCGVSAFGLAPVPASSSSSQGEGLFGERRRQQKRHFNHHLLLVGPLSLSSENNSNNNNSNNNTTTNNNNSPKDAAQLLKQDLLAALAHLKDTQARDGDFSDIDWGTKGGELTETGRVPKQVDYGLISPAVGKAAQAVLDLCDQLETVMPSSMVPTQYLGDKENGSKAALEGAWKLLFSNAADAVFSKDSKRGAARTQNVVDAKRGRITNIIDFEPATDEHGEVKQPTLKQLNIVIQAKALNGKRVELNFKYAKVVLTKFFFFPLFGRTLSLYIPVPATLVTQVIEFCKTVARFFRLKKKNDTEKRTAKGYFDILYLDNQLRVHKTGQGNIFVQARNDWKEAIPLIR